MSDKREQINHEVQEYLANITRKYYELGNGSSPEENEAKTQVCFSQEKKHIIWVSPFVNYMAEL